MKPISLVLNILYADGSPTRGGVALVGALLVMSALPVAALSDVPGEIDWFIVGMGLFGGLAMFLFGMEQMSDGLKAAAGDTLKDVLARLTRNRALGALTGAFVTAVLNSSSVTTVLVVSFISAGFMTLAQSVGVIMGANIGSTFTAQIVAFNVTQYALIMVAIGFFMLFTARQEKMRHYGSMIMGLGLVFYGMGVMGEAMTPLRSYQPFLDLMVKMENPLLGILVGAVFTGLVQSSAATTGIAIVMATEGLITLPAGIALAFGANVGTCVTAILAALGKPVEAVRAAAVHILFNIVGVLLWVMFIPQLADFVAAISPASPELSGKARLAAEVPRQIANAHTVFNIANTVIFIGFTGVFARVAERLVPDRPVDEKIIVRPRYLDKAAIKVTSMALEQVRFEIAHMGEIVCEMFATLRNAVAKGDKTLCDKVLKMDDKVDILHDAILEYLAEARKEQFTEEQSIEFQSLMTATINMESLADVIETELVEIGKKYIDLQQEPSDATLMLLVKLADHIEQSLTTLVESIQQDDETLAQDVILMKDVIRTLSEEFMQLQSQRMGMRDGKLDIVRLEMDLVDKLRRIYTLSKRIAREFVPREVASKV